MNRFKKASKIVFDSLAKTNITVKDIEYLDGYFIFEHGKDTVVHFHIEECPGWLFAIWWDTHRRKDKEYLTGQFFCQYEATIDKFKPHRSNILCDINIKLKDGYAPDRMVNIINFINKQPYLAFCRDYCGWDYNTEYHSPEEAEQRFNNWFNFNTLKTEIKSKNDVIILEWIKENVLPLYNNATIEDLGNSWSPRYFVKVPINDNPRFIETGCYDWYEYDEEPLYLEWKTLTERLHEEAWEHNIIWYPPLHADVEVM